MSGVRCRGRSPIGKKASKKRTSRAGWVTQSVLARLFGVDSRTIRRWTDEGMPIESRSGRSVLYKPAKAIAWRRQRDREEVERALRPSTFQEARTDKMIAEARLVQLKLGRECQQLMTVEHLNNALNGAFTRVRVILIPLPRRAAADVFAATTMKEVIAILEQHVEGVLQQLYDADDVPESDEAA